MDNWFAKDTDRDLMTVRVGSTADRSPAETEEKKTQSENQTHTHSECVTQLFEVVNYLD